MHGLAMYGSLGPSGGSVATNNLAVLAEMAAVQGHDFAIDYDDRLRKHIATEEFTMAQAIPLLRAPVDDRVNSLLQRLAKEDRERHRAAGGRGGKGAGQAQHSHQGGHQGQNQQYRLKGADGRGDRRDFRRDDRHDDRRDDRPAAAGAPSELKLLGPSPKRQAGRQPGGGKWQRGGR